MGRLLAPSLLLVALGGLAGCGEDSDAPAASEPSSSGSSSTSASESASGPADAPACDEIWTEGATIPRGYRGCTDESGYVERDALGCSSGQRMVTYSDRFYGVLGGTVRTSAGSLEDDREYIKAVRSCRA